MAPASSSAARPGDSSDADRDAERAPATQAAARDTAAGESAAGESRASEPAAGESAADESQSGDAPEPDRATAATDALAPAQARPATDTPAPADTPPPTDTPPAADTRPPIEAPASADRPPTEPAATDALAPAETPPATDTPAPAETPPATDTPEPVPSAFFAIERGTATLAVSLIGRVGARWRLLAATALPAGADEGATRRLLVDRVTAADPAIAAGAAVHGATSADGGGDLPVLAAEGRPAPTLLVVAGTERTRTRASLAATGAGWRLASGGSAQRSDPLALTFAGTRTGVRAVLAAVNDPPDSDERDLPAELSMVAAGIASRRRDVPLLLAGPLPFEPARGVAQGLRIVPLPAPGAASPPGEALRLALLEERAGPTASRRALVAAAGSLARVLDLRVELLEIGASGGIRVRADPVADAGAAARGPRALKGGSSRPGRGAKGKRDEHAVKDASSHGAVRRGFGRRRATHAGTAANASPAEPTADGAAGPHPVRIRSMEVPAAALFALDDAAAFDRLEAWTTLALDRARLRDRVAELQVLPWSDLDGEGAILRATALRAALERLLAVTDPVLGTDAPDLAVGAGGAWSALPGPAAAHVLADVLRRPGAVQLATDHARLLAPLGTIEDDGERDAVVADLIDDLLLPLGTVITPRGLRANRPAGPARCSRPTVAARRSTSSRAGSRSSTCRRARRARSSSPSSRTSSSGPRAGSSPSPSAAGSPGSSSTCAMCPLRSPGPPRPAARGPDVVGAGALAGAGRMTTAGRGADVPSSNGLELVPIRRLVSARPRVRLELRPGDRTLVVAGAHVRVGDLLAERVRDPRLVEVPGARGTEPGADAGHVGQRGGRPHRSRGVVATGEVLYEHGGTRRLAAGTRPDLLYAPATGRVAAIEPGAGIVLELEGVAITAREMLGDPHHGRLVVLPEDADPRLALDVGLAGAIVVLPGRADAEVLARARAMGIHGAVIGSLSDRDRRDLAASEARQRAGLHRLAPFAVLVLDGFLRRPFSTSVRTALEALSGYDVGIVGRPPLLVAPAVPGGLPRPAPDRVRVRGGIESGNEGTWVGLAGPRRVRAGLSVECGIVVLDDGRTVALPIGEVERFA